MEEQAAPTATPASTPGSQSVEDPPSATPTPTPAPTGGTPSQLPEAGGIPANGPSGSPHVWLAATFVGLMLAAAGLTALRMVRRQR